MRLTFAVLLLSASTALGQTLAVNFTVPGTTSQNTEIVVSKNTCADIRTVNWTRTGALACSSLIFWLSPDNCTGEPGTGDLVVGNEVPQGDTTNLSGSLQLKMSDALAASSPVLSCDTQAENKSYRLCASTEKQDSTLNCDDERSNIAQQTITFTLDPVAPNPPALPTVTGLDSALSVSVTVPSDTSQMKVQVVELVQGEDGGTPTAGKEVVAKTQTTDNTVFRMEGLENGKLYGVLAYAFDKAGNDSKASPLATGEPIPSNGFYAAYREAGGQETGGCGAGGGGLALGAVVAALGFWMMSRRKLS